MTDVIKYIPLTLLDEHPHNQEWLPPHSPEELQALTASMQNGFQIAHPLIGLESQRTGRCLILDGNTRFRTAKAMSQNAESPEVPELPVSVIGSLDDPAWTPAQQRLFMETLALSRRNISKKQKDVIVKSQATRGIAVNEISSVLAIPERTVTAITQEVREARKDAQKEGVLVLRAAGKSQEETAEIVGVDRATVANWETGNSGRTAEIPVTAPGDNSSESITAKEAEAKVLEKHPGLAVI